MKIEKAENLFIEMTEVSDEKMVNEKAEKFVDSLFTSFNNLSAAKKLCLNLLRFFLLKEEDLTNEAAASTFFTFVVCEVGRMKERIWDRIPELLNSVCRLDEDDSAVIEVKKYFDMFRQKDFFMQEQELYQVIAIIRLRYNDLDKYFATGGACNWFQNSGVY